MKRTQIKNRIRIQRSHAVRSKVRAYASSPRLSVFRSNADLYVQVIDDETSRTVASGHLREIKATKTKEPNARIERSHALGKLIAERAIKAGVKKVVFDRGRYAYHGRVKAVAEGAREGGLTF